jgi:hypothetical protein
VQDLYIVAGKRKKAVVKGFSSIWMMIRECCGEKKTDLAFHEQGKGNTFPFVTGKTNRPSWKDFFGDDKVRLW